METPDVRDARNVENLLRKATGNKQSQPKRDNMWTANNKVMEAGLPKSTRAHITTPFAPDVGHEATGFTVFPAGFQSFYDPIPTSERGVFTLLPLYLGSTYLFIGFYRIHTKSLP
jgi:hypothetical protein